MGFYLTDRFLKGMINYPDGLPLFFRVGRDEVNFRNDPSSIKTNASHIKLEYCCDELQLVPSNPQDSLFFEIFTTPPPPNVPSPLLRTDSPPPHHPSHYSPCILIFCSPSHTVFSAYSPHFSLEKLNRGAKK